jgi:2-polyprenyl-3-methyl-5-hydroxy-6-metoxy-1,4-benzoquinol methylase
MELLPSLSPEEIDPGCQSTNTVLPINVMPFDETYFSSHTYKNVSTALYSQYWWSNRFYAILAHRYGKANGRLLEVGSGLGHLAGQLEGQFETHASDVNYWALCQSKNVGRNTRRVLACAQELPYQAGSFDVVILKHVVEHLEQPRIALEEAGRICAPAGLLILATPNLASRLKPWKGDKWIGYQDPTHISLKEPGEWITIVQTAGFKIFKIFSDGFWDVPYIRHIPAAVQKILFGVPGGLQAVSGIPFLPLQWGESMILLARKEQPGSKTN